MVCACITVCVLMCLDVGAFLSACLQALMLNLVKMRHAVTILFLFYMIKI